MLTIFLNAKLGTTLPTILNNDPENFESFLFVQGNILVCLVFYETVIISLVPYDDAVGYVKKTPSFLNILYRVQFNYFRHVRMSAVLGPQFKHIHRHG